jgi:mannosyltransferase
LWEGKAPTSARGVPTTEIARKITAIRRVLAVICLFLVVIGQLNALDALYADPAYARDDYRAIAALIMADPRPGDAIILDAPNQVEVFTYYYHGDRPIYELPRGLGGDDDRTRADVQAVLRDHQRIFVLFWGEAERDPNRVVQAALDAGAYPVTSAWYGDVRLAQYAVLGAAPAGPDVQTGARFGAHITLTGYALSAETLRPGDVVGVTLFWTTDAPLDTRYKVTVQFLAPDGSLITQHDAEPGGDRFLTTTWTPGQTVIDTHGIVIPPDLSPGDYTLIVGLYDLDAPLDRLPVTVDGEAVGDVFALPAVLK